MTESFDALYERTRDGLLTYLLRRVEQSADAADLLSEVYLVAWRRRSDPPEDPELWLYGVARTLLKAHRRRSNRHRDLAERLREQVTEQYAPTQDELYVRQVLSTLPPRLREVMELSVYLELTPAEIAEVVGTRPGAVRTRLSRARSKLAAVLEADEEPVSEQSG